MNKGFTLIELIVTIAIIAILSGIILFSVTQYIGKGKDSNIYANLAVLIPAGEVFYNGNDSSYQGFCASDVVSNSFRQMPSGVTPYCSENSENSYQSWAACAQEFSSPGNFYCVDSRGAKGSYSGTCSAINQCP